MATSSGSILRLDSSRNDFAKKNIMNYRQSPRSDLLFPRLKTKGDIFDVAVFGNS